MTDMTTIVEGTIVPTLRPGRISRTTLALFAGASGDHNPIHIDTDAAAAAGFDDVFAHGMLSMAYLSRLLTEWIPQHQIREISARFISITPVNTEPELTGEVTSVAEVDGERLATVRLSVRLPDGTETLTGSAIIVD